MNASDEEKGEFTQAEILSTKNDPDAKYGGREARAVLERKLLFTLQDATGEMSKR